LHREKEEKGGKKKRAGRTDSDGAESRLKRAETKIRAGRRKKRAGRRKGREALRVIGLDPA